jgi:hypothetical protein
MRNLIQEVRTVLRKSLPASLVLSVLLSFFLVSCGVSKTILVSSIDNLPYPGGRGPRWLYNGPLPQLKSIEQVVVSLKGHTVRVTGVLPDGFDTELLPYYAHPQTTDAGQTRVTLVYPIATANTAAGSRNATPGVHARIDAIGYKTLNEIAEWGGFPFLVYEPNRAIGFHGPITHHGAGGSQWQLIRGPVSHGCNRMQGEHLLELAHLLGLDTKSTRYAPDAFVKSLPVEVQVLSPAQGYDVFQGKAVDVDYPGSAGFQPPSNAGLETTQFRTWDGMKLTRYACTFDAQSGLGENRCQHRPENSIDPLTGFVPLGNLGCPNGFWVQDVGGEGGKVCANQHQVYAHFTQEMLNHCLAWGGGPACHEKYWNKALALDARGKGLCPVGAQYDPRTRYCVEGTHALGPFPKDLVARCVSENGGDACATPRWNRQFLEALLK